MGLVSLAPLLAIVLHVAGTLLLWASAAYCLVSVLIVVGELRWLRKYFRVLKKGRELSRRRIKYEYRVVRPVLFPLLAANSVIARLLHKRTGFRFDSKFIEHYGRLYKDLFGLDYRKADTNNYWLCSFYVAQRAPFLFRQQLNWLHLYSFARNLSIALYLDFLYCCAVLTYNDPFLPSASCCDAAATLLRSLPLLYFFVSLMLLLRYYYLYSCYYTRHLLRAFVYLGSPASQVEFPSGGSQAPSD